MASKGLEAGMATVAALAEPIRRALYLHVVSSPAPVSRDEAARALDVKRHVAKFHLDRLVDDRLLEAEYRRPPGRGGPGAGRPAKLYRRSRRQIDISVPERRYEFASQLLAQAITDAVTESVPVDIALQRVAFEAGHGLADAARREIGSGKREADPLSAATKVLTDHGYEPRYEHPGLTLGNCPFHALARDHKQLACGMNLEILKGLVEGLGIDGVVATLDPSPTRCCVRLVDAAAPDSPNRS